MNNFTKHEVKPNAKALIEALRYMGYEINTSVADLVDNSIDAGAKNIFIQFEMDVDGNIDFSITDDGKGMDEKGLLNALTYGAGENLERVLGKFGLGLKTSSTAFCKKIIVTSRNDKKSDFLSAMMDIDELQEEWEINVGKADEKDYEMIEEFSENGTGTCVRWDKIDNFLPNFHNQADKKRKDAFKKVIENKITNEGLKNHLSWTFSELIKEKNGINIYLNNERIEYKDLFLRKVSKNLTEGEKVINVEDPETGKIIDSFRLIAWATPPRNEMTKEMKQEIAYKNTRMGFYVFRENRLISSAETFGLFTKESHGSLFRAELHFSSKLDSFFKVDVKKGTLLPNEDLLAVLGDFAKVHLMAANNIYRQSGAKTKVELSKDVHKNSNASIEKKILELPETAKVESVADNKPTIINSKGQKTQLSIVYDDEPDTNALYIKTSEELEGFNLYAPTIDKHHNSGVVLNVSHEFYPRVYLPQKLLDPNAYLAIDYLLYALARAELNNTSEASKIIFEDLRTDVSRTLRQLADNLPESKDE